MVDFRKIKTLENIKKKVSKAWKDTKSELVQKAAEKALKAGRFQRAILETKKITPNLCGRCKRHVSRIMLMESDKMKHFKEFDWCKKCTPKVKKLESFWDEESAMMVGFEKKK